MSFQSIVFNQRLKYSTVNSFKRYSYLNLKPTHAKKPLQITYHYTTSSSPPSKPEYSFSEGSKKKVEDWGEIISRYYKQYQDFVGISKVYEAQERVSLFSDKLFEVQTRRRRLQKEVEEIHQQLLATHQRITKSELYSEDHYSLFEKARELNGTLKTLQSQFVQTEEEERNIFTQLSTAIKYCHEQERVQSDQSKYWSILISVVSATLGALITSINNWVRIKEIKDHSTVLHQEVINKTKSLQTVFTDSINTINKSNSKEPSPPPTESFLESLQTVIRDEMKQILKQTENSHNSQSVNDLSYFKIAGSMVSGALVGIIITYNLLGSAGGGGGG